MTKIESRGHTALLVGGTGFYLRALRQPFFEAPPTDERLHRRLARTRERRRAEHLHKILRRLDPEAAARLQPRDWSRVQRAMKVRLQTGAPLSAQLSARPAPPLQAARLRVFALSPPRAELYRHINERTEAHFRAGLVEEVRELLARGVYHIHGFVPSNVASNYGARPGGQGRAFTDSFNHMLVFTGAQYWSTSATALAFANRVMLSALSETRCVFIGLSMTDINLLRWLALRTLERDRDISEMPLRGGPRLQAIQRPASDDPTGFPSEFLAVRGIRSVELKKWTGAEFQRLIQKCFPGPTRKIRVKTKTA